MQNNNFKYLYNEKKSWKKKVSTPRLRGVRGGTGRKAEQRGPPS